MKDKILASLKTKYSNLGFSDKAFNGVADYLATTITEEDKIETGISGVESLLKAFQSDADKIRTENANLKKQLEKKDEPDPNKDKDPKNQKPADQNDALQKLLDRIEAQDKKLSALEAGKTEETRKGLLEKELANTSESFRSRILKDFGRMSFKDDEDFNAYLEETKTDAATNAQEIANTGLKNHPKPASGSKNQKEAASKEEVDAVVKEIM